MARCSPGDDRGSVSHWELVDGQLSLTDVSQVGGASVSALEWALGGNSWLVATEDGAVSGWLRAPLDETRSAMMRAHVYEPQGSPVVALAFSGRERSFASVGRDGGIVLRHQTSERVLATLPSAGPVSAVLITPKADGLLTLEAGALERYALDNPHPEVSWTTLFGKVWYEGYAKPEYVWQSTGATDDIEPKFSLVPLVFGTIKGTLYAMLFAVPLAVLAALYTSQFADAGFRATIKPAVEIMAALPSVVIGFLAGLYLAGVVERNLVAVLLMMVLHAVVRHVGRHLLALAAGAGAIAGAAGRRAGADRPAPDRRRLGRRPHRSDGRGLAVRAATSASGSPRASGSPTISATAWWSASRWVSRSSRSSSRSPRTRSRVCRPA